MKRVVKPLKYLSCGDLYGALEADTSEGLRNHTEFRLIMSYTRARDPSPGASPKEWYSMALRTAEMARAERGA